MSFTRELWLKKRGRPRRVMEIRECFQKEKVIATSVSLSNSKTLSHSGCVLSGKDGGDAVTCYVCVVCFLLLQINKTAVRKYNTEPKNFFW